MKGLKILLAVILAISLVLPLISFSGCEAGKHFSNGYTLWQQDKYEEAVVELTKTIELNPNHPNAHDYRGRCYVYLKQYDLAIQDLSVAIGRDSKNAYAFYYRGCAYARAGQRDLAVLDFNQAIAFSTASDLTQYATQEIEKVSQSSDGSQSPNVNQSTGQASDYYQQGVELFNQGKSDEAIAELTKAIEIDPGYVPAYLQRGVIYYKNGQYDLAIADSSKAIELDPEYIDAYDTRGNAYKDSGQTDKAIADYQKIVELSKNPDQVKYYTDRLASLGQPPSGFTGFSGDSVYDGEFIGEFTYWYKEWHTDAEGHTVESDWKPETLRVSLKLKALVSDVLVRQTGVTNTVVKVTHVWVSDPAFGTGLAGITPAYPSAGTLPLDPTSPTNPSELGMGILISFPNGASLCTQLNAGALSVSFPVVPTLSSSLDPTWQDSTWSAVLPAGSGSILGYDDPSNDSGYAIKYKKWTLTKSNR